MANLFANQIEFHHAAIYRPSLRRNSPRPGALIAAVDIGGTTVATLVVVELCCARVDLMYPRPSSPRRGGVPNFGSRGIGGRRDNDPFAAGPHRRRDRRVHSLQAGVGAIKPHESCLTAKSFAFNRRSPGQSCCVVASFHTSDCIDKFTCCALYFALIGA